MKTTQRNLTQLEHISVIVYTEHIPHATVYVPCTCSHGSRCRARKNSCHQLINAVLLVVSSHDVFHFFHIYTLALLLSLHTSALKIFVHNTLRDGPTWRWAWPHGRRCSSHRLWAQPARDSWGRRWRQPDLHRPVLYPIPQRLRHGTAGPSWNRWRAPQERVYSITASAGKKSKHRPESNSSLTWREFVTKRTVDFTYGETWISVKWKRIESRIGGRRSYVRALSPARTHTGRSKVWDPKVWRKSQLRWKKYMCNLKRQIETGDWDPRRDLEGFLEASQAKDRLQQEVADREQSTSSDLKHPGKHLQTT